MNFFKIIWNCKYSFLEIWGFLFLLSLIGESDYTILKRLIISLLFSFILFMHIIGITLIYKYWKDAKKNKQT